MKRTNNISTKFILFAAAIILTVLLVGLMFVIQKNQANTINSSNNQVTSKFAEYDEPEKSSYDGLSVSGAVVVDVIEDMATDSTTVVKVVTKQNVASKTDGKTYTDSNIITTKTDPNYINPIASFTGSVTRNENGIITQISFMQE